MAGYKYEATDEELKAAKLLKKKGWNVQEPSCPLCHGWGRVDRILWWMKGEKPPTKKQMWGKECPNGCETPSMFF